MKRRKPLPPNFPPKLKLKGKDGEGHWKVRIVGSLVTNPDPSDDPLSYPYEDTPTHTPLVAQEDSCQTQ